MSAGPGTSGAPVLTVDDARDPAAEQVISEGLRGYNETQCGISDGRALNVVARDPETNSPLGGITGHTSLGVLFIDLFFLPEALRRGGVGSRLLQLAEDEGRRRGCHRDAWRPGDEVSSHGDLDRCPA